MILWVVPMRPGWASKGPFSGYPKIAPARPGAGVGSNASEGKLRPGTRRTAMSSAGSNAIA
jgi:hypothetical protein